MELDFDLILAGILVNPGIPTVSESLGGPREVLGGPREVLGSKIQAKIESTSNQNRIESKSNQNPGRILIEILGNPNTIIWKS